MTEMVIIETIILSYIQELGTAVLKISLPYLLFPTLGASSAVITHTGIQLDVRDRTEVGGIQLVAF